MSHSLTACLIRSRFASTRVSSLGQKGAAEAHYALDNLPNKIVAAEYRTVLPDEALIAEELERTRVVLESRAQSSDPGEATSK